MGIESLSWVWMHGCVTWRENYVHAKRALGRSYSPFLEHPLSQVGQLFYSERSEDRREALKVLAAFRELLEEHISVDTTRLLGEI